MQPRDGGSPIFCYNLRADQKGTVPCEQSWPKEGCVLILTRQLGETLMIGDQITVTVLGIKGNQVRLGVNAPKNIAVHREEIYEKIRKENREQ